MDKDSLFVSDHDLVALTGYKNKTGQIKYLKSIGIPFNVNGRGKPVVLKTDIDSSAKAPSIKESKEWRSNQI